MVSLRSVGMGWAAAGRPRFRRVGLAALLALQTALACGPVYRPAGRPAGVVVPIHDRYARARVELLEAINGDRASAGRHPVVLDSLATIVAQAHAEAMAAERFFSHYGRGGDAPYERLAEAGGAGHVRENIFRWRVSGLLAGEDPWEGFGVDRVEAWLMGSSGHRATILDPHRTGVGLGIASDRVRGAVYVVQDFVARHVEITAPSRAWRGATTSVSGHAPAGSVRPLLVVLHAEPDRRSWEDGGEPPEGSYADGGGAATVLPPWAIEWRRTDRFFSADLPIHRGSPAGRYYGIVYVADERAVERALDRRTVWTTDGWPGAAFLIDVF